MAAPDIPAAKRAGLPVDLARLGAEGDGWLSPEERYALKTYGVCAQVQPEVFMVRVRIPGGVAPTAQVRGLARVAARYADADGHLTFTRDQNITFRNVPLAHVADIRSAIGERGLSLLGEGRTAQIRACTGSAVCSLGITDSPGAGQSLAGNAALRRNAALRVFISGCPNSCAQHQIGDIGLAGSKVRVNGVTTDGYQVYLGNDLDRHEIGVVVGRVALKDLDAAVSAVVGTWEALRHPGESLGRTVRRLSPDAFSLQIEAALDDRWAPGPEPVDQPVAVSP